MIVKHNMSDPKSVAKPFGSSIVDNVNTSVNSGYNAYDSDKGIITPSPTSIGESQTDVVNSISDSQYDVVNKAKITELAIWSGSTTNGLLSYITNTGDSSTIANAPFGNWRDYSLNHFCQISERVMLNVDKMPDMGGSINYVFKSSKDILNSGMLKTVKGVTETINNVANGIGAIQAALGGKASFTAPAGEYFSRLQETPVVDFKSTSTKGMDSLTFNFRFGQAGIFSGEEEVVKPILALMNIYSLRSSGNNLTSPFPTLGKAKADAQAAFIASLAGGTLQEAVGMANVDSPDAGFIQKGINIANSLTNALFQARDRAAEQATLGMNTLVVMLGGAVSGPYVPGTISWNFDFENVDEFGFPTSGSLTFGGLKSILLMTGADYISQWGYTMGTSGNEIVKESGVDINAYANLPKNNDKDAINDALVGNPTS